MASEMLAQKAVENVIKESKESGSEPPAAIVGKGTADSPSNGGNLPGTNTQPGVEPPSGQKGAGIAGDPYDQGNALGTQSTLVRLGNQVDSAFRTRPSPRRSVITLADLVVRLIPCPTFR